MGIVTGQAPSRLSELRKFRSSGTLSQKYFTSNTRNINGVDVDASTENELIVYYLDDIKYQDFFDNGDYLRTEFDYTALGTNSPDFINFPIIKDSAKENIVSQPEVDNDVFIIRQSLSVFENQYRLRAVRNLSELNLYAGGSNFNIISNT